MNTNWFKNYDPDVPHTIDPDQYTSMIQLLEEGFKKYADKPCFINFKESLTYSQVDTLSQCFAGYLQNQCGCVKGDRIAMLMLNTLQYPVAIYGALRAGLIVVGISPISTAESIRRILKETEPKCILVLSNLAPVLESALAVDPPSSIKQIIVSHMGDLLGFFKGSLTNFTAKYKAKTLNWDLPNVIMFKETIKMNFKDLFIQPDIVPEDPAFLQQSSGRDGPIPKCVIFSHRNMISQILQITSWLTGFWKGKHNNGFLSLMPLYHHATLTPCICCSLQGYANVLVTNPLDIPGMINELEHNEYFGTICISSLIRNLMLNDKINEIDFTNFELTGGWGGFYGIDIIRWKTLTDSMIIEGYGSVEAPISTINPITLNQFNTKVGLPLPSVEIKICDDEGKELPIDTRGELWIRGPHVTKGYWNNPDLTTKSFTEDGWFRTGDIVTIDHDGFLGFVDRKSDVIMTTAGPVYPSDIEVVIAFMKGVQEVVIASQKSKEQGTIIKAFVVRSNTSLTIEDIKKHCQKYLLEHQVPHEIEFRETLPKTELGYHFRRVLREESEGQN